ncbi:PCMD domain-containing protein [Bacteroidota bacterium]
MKRIVFLLLLTLTLESCDEKELSSIAEILSFNITEINTDKVDFNNVVIEKEHQKVFLMTSDPFNSESFPIQIIPDIDISNGASIIPGSGEKITFESDTINFLYLLSAEDGTEYEWYLSLISNQLPNSDFEAWYEAEGLDGKYYPEPGISESTTLWATANKATSIYDVLGTTPLEDRDNTLVKITTGETNSVPVTAGTLFTGKFDVRKAINNPTDPQKGTDFGIPFSNRPAALKIKYRYEPGENYIKATLKDPNSIFGGFDVTPLDGGDRCKIFSYLEVRDGENSTIIGELEFISGDTVTDLTELSLIYTYTSSDTPTHITVVFTSSTDGDLFTGAVGSTLIVDDLELIYE